MQMRRPLFTAVVLSLLVGMMGGIGGGSTALAAPPSLVIPVSGTVEGLPVVVNGPPERVTLAGLARITSVLVTDTTFDSPPSVILTIDILIALGKGLVSKQMYATLGTDQVYRTRLLVSSDQVEITFPFFPIGPRGAALAVPALASFALSFDANTGDITRATGNLTTPKF